VIANGGGKDGGISWLALYADGIQGLYQPCTECAQGGPVRSLIYSYYATSALVVYAVRPSVITIYDRPTLRYTEFKVDKKADDVISLV